MSLQIPSRAKLSFLVLALAAGFVMFSGTLWAADLPSTGAEPDLAVSGSRVSSSGTGNQTVGSLDSLIQTYFIKGDRGRFRQDWLTDDQTTGGVKDLSLQWASGDVKYEYEGRALLNYDYLSRLEISKGNEFFSKIEWKQFRKYWDGSQDKEVWNPLTYGLSPDFQDFDDRSLHADRGNVEIEIGRRITDEAKLIFDYDVWTRKGRMPTLRGDAAAATGLNTLRSIAMRTRVDGVSNTISLRLPVVINEIHYVEPLISFEAYRDDQFTDSVRYTNGALSQKRDYIDVYDSNDLKAQVTYHSFVKEKVYLHGGYFFNFLENENVRSEVRPNLAVQSVYVDPSVDNWRVSNVFSLGSTLLDILRKKGLDLRLGFRGEHAVTDTHGTLSQNGTTARVSDSALKEGWFGEVLSLTYRHSKDTTVYLGLDMEQRRLHWDETFDAAAHEIVTTFGSTELFPRYDTRITFIDFVPRLKMTHRFNSKTRAYAEYRWKAKQRQYNTKADTLPGFYPGILGDQARQVQEVTTKLDIKLSPTWTSTLKYQFVADNLDSQKVGEGQQDLDRNRFSLNFSGPVGDKLFAFISGIYEIYRVNTPTFGSGNNRWGLEEGAYDFVGDYFMIATNWNYHLSDKVSTFLAYQVTDSQGDNSNLLNEFSVGFEVDISKTASFETRYQVFNFRDNRGYDGTFDDDYYGHGLAFAFKKAFV